MHFLSSGFQSTTHEYKYMKSSMVQVHNVGTHNGRTKRLPRVTSMHGHETCMCCRIMKAFHVHVAKRKRSVRVFEGRNNEFLRGTEKRVQ